MYYKIRIEGWVEKNVEVVAKHGLDLEDIAYEMSKGNGICTLFTILESTDNANELDGGAENFFESDVFDEKDIPDDKDVE